MTKTSWFALPIVLLPLVFSPALVSAADITGTAKVREGDSIAIGNSRIRLGAIDAPSIDRLKGEAPMQPALTPETVG